MNTVQFVEGLRKGDRLERGGILNAIDVNTGKYL